MEFRESATIVAKNREKVVASPGTQVTVNWIKFQLGYLGQRQTAQSETEKSRPLHSPLFSGRARAGLVSPVCPAAE